MVDETTMTWPKNHALDAAVMTVRARIKAGQARQLMAALGVDPTGPNAYRDAFIRLAEVHHGVGRLVHRWVPGSKRRRKGSLEFAISDSILIDDVRAIVDADSVSEREAVRRLAKGRNVSESALRQRYQRAKRSAAARPKPDSVDLADLRPPALNRLPCSPGLLSMSEFEWDLWSIESAQARGDNYPEK
jgi:hypothetical protein